LTRKVHALETVPCAAPGTAIACCLTCNHW